VNRPALAAVGEPDPQDLALKVARALLALHDSRAKTMGQGLFADPAWDMLLDLFVAEGEGRRICVSSLCLASRVPASTAHRWVQALARAGTIERRGDPLDRRRIYVALSEAGSEALRSELLTHHARLACLLDR
jgi:DNA-binding MarR family transcriptional regulator